MTAREVVLEGGSPWGFRIHGGADVQQPLRISRVNPGSKSSTKGIREGDIITSINSKSTSEVTNSEAHALLKNSGETLVLGLNEEPRTSSKKRIISKTVQLETTEDASETIRNTTTTSITINRNSNDATHQFSSIKINGVSENKEPSENAVASQASTLSSNCSSSPSTASVYSDLGGIGIYDSVQDNPAARNYYTKLIAPDNVLTNMTDMLGDSSRSTCKKRTRIDSSQTLHNEMKHSGDKNTILERFQTLEYRVDSPETVNKKPKLGQTVKSRSLDDDDVVKITELSEVSESEDNKESGAVAEIESDDNSEICKTQLSVQDEQNLRTYLGGLNLSSSGENKESYKERKARTRAAIAEHFMPVFQQPRFLDVISEECSDSSGEHQTETKRRKRACVNTEREIVQVRGSELNESESVQGITWNTITPQTSSAEVVYLDIDSSPSDESDAEDDPGTAKLSTVYQLTPPPTPDGEDDILTPKTFLKNFCNDPESLRNLCRKKLVSLPFGCDILQELADVSESIQNLTKNWRERHSLTLEKVLTSHEESPQSSSRLLSIIQEGRASASRDINFNKITQCFDDHNMLVIKRNQLNATNAPKRRLSLPQDIFERQLEEIREKERQLQDEIEKLEEEKRRVLNEMGPHQKEFEASNYYMSKKGDYSLHNGEIFRQKMYEEYMSKIAALHERKLHKIIKITSPHQIVGSAENLCEITHVSGIENEFMCKVQERMRKFGLNIDEDREVSPAEDNEKSVPVLVIDGNALKDSKELPKHLREFVELTERAADADEEAELTHGVWSPGQKSTETRSINHDQRTNKQDDPIPPVWTPRSAGSSPTAERKEFKPVNFDSPTLGRRHKVEIPTNAEAQPASQPAWQAPPTSSEVGRTLSSSLDKRLPTSHSAPASGFMEYSTPRLPKAQNPTITLLQKAREGQLPKGASYIQHTDSLHSYRNQDDRPSLRQPGEVLYQVKNEYTSEIDTNRSKKMADLSQKRYEIGIGPTGSDGMPLGLRSEVKEANQSKWYRKMYDTIHKQKPDREYVTVRYKQRRARYPYVSGYFSEPEHSPGNFSAYYYDSDGPTSDNKYSTLDRRRLQQTSSDKQYVNDHYMSSSLPRPRDRDHDREDLHRDAIKHGQDAYKNQPGRIENYMPGRSSISEKEAKEWWDEVMDIFDGHLDQQKRTQPQPKSFINQALKESGYESDSTLIFKRREEAAQQLSPTEQREAYKTIQKGGDVPLQGLRKLAPERPKEPEAPTPPPKGHQGLNFFKAESPRKYVENEVTIHYKTPVRQEVKESLSEEELSRRQAEHMKRVYEDERRRKYLQVSDSVNNELQDINSRRHTDNFTPTQKSPISLNRYDDFPAEEPPRIKQRPKSPEPRLIARALYNFVGQSARELTFRKGDIIYIRRQVDKNWYEGEHNAMIGLFPSNYVEIIPFDGAKSTPRKPYEGQARAKFNFIAQTNLELSLAKGELVVIIRRVDDNWYEGRIGGRKGIFPISYVEVLIDPAANPPSPSNTTNKPVSSPAAHSLLLNGSAGGKESMGSHSYTPSVPYQQQFASSYRNKTPHMNGTSYGSLSRSMVNVKNPVNEALHIDTHLEPIPYRALYKYRPQNEDELELLEGDVVFVLEKCDDGWYVGSSQRTGAFGTFPGNYVERV